MSEEQQAKIQVIDDMYSDRSLISYAARCYYYEHYATEAERKQIDRADKLETILAYLIVGLTAALLIGYMALSILEVYHG